jgi:hypothetical protein
MDNFKKLKTTILGDIGEAYISEFASHFGCRAFGPLMEGSNPVDSLSACYNKKTGKWKVIGIEVKTKERLSAYEMTGMDTIDLKTYVEFDNPVCVIFVDYLSGSIYYQWAKELDKNKVEMFGHQHVIYFPLSIMKEYRKLNEDEIKILKDNSNSNYKS